MDPSVQVAWIEAIVPLCIVAAFVVAAVLNRRRIGPAFDRMTRLKVAGVEVELSKAARDLEVRPQRTVPPMVSKRLRDRAMRLAPQIAGMRILWVDDEPRNNAAERAFLRAAGAYVANATSTAEGLARLRNDDWDLVITDFERGGDKHEGELLAQRARAEGHRMPFIGYVSRANPGAPAHFRRVVDRPDHLIDEVLDIADRR